MAKKAAKIEKLDSAFGREDMDALVAKVNELVDHANGETE